MSIKEPPPPLSFSSHPPPPTCTILLHYELVDMDFSFFSALCFILLYVRKEVVIFGNNVSGVKNCKGFSLPSKRIDNAELF